MSAGDLTRLELEAALQGCHIVASRAVRYARLADARGKVDRAARWDRRAMSATTAAGKLYNLLKATEG